MIRSSLHARAGALVAFVLTIAACSSARDDNAAGSAANGASSQNPGVAAFDSMAGMRPAGDSARPAPRQRALDLCHTLPTDTVARILRTTIGKTVSAATPRAGGMCTYREGSIASPSVRVQVDLGRDRSAAAAKITLLGQRGQLGKGGVQTTDIPGIGDSAFGGSDSTGSYSVMMQVDVVTGRVSVFARGADAQTLRPAAVEIMKRTLAVLQSAPSPQ